jgi:hypothetical protein
MKILAAAPIDAQKDYCWAEFSEALRQLKVAGKLLIDTSKKGDIVKLLREPPYTLGFEIILQPWHNKAMDRVAHARQLIVNYAVEHEYTHVLMLDADTIPEPNLAFRLANHNLDVVSGIAFTLNKENNLPAPNAWLLTDKKNIYKHIPDKWIGTGVRKVDSVGMAATLIKTEVFDKAMFSCERNPAGKLKMSEDFCFCKDSKAAGFDINCDTDIQVIHKITGNWKDDA